VNLVLTESGADGRSSAPNLQSITRPFAATVGSKAWTKEFLPARARADADLRRRLRWEDVHHEVIVEPPNSCANVRKSSGPFFSAMRSADSMVSRSRFADPEPRPHQDPGGKARRQRNSRTSVCRVALALVHQAILVRWRLPMGSRIVMMCSCRSL